MADVKPVITKRR